MAQCVKCGGPTMIRSEVAIGTLDYCNRCGPRFTPPYTPARIARAKGEPLPLPPNSAPALKGAGDATIEGARHQEDGPAMKGPQRAGQLARASKSALDSCGAPTRDKTRRTGASPAWPTRVGPSFMWDMQCTHV
jgi:hypothetical protein